ncbi:MAG TPA: cytosine deaminase [Candidatus Aphodomonas merdavium]|nr:cytosine deaminase [Candidatus Aphodomonas merdavium]
MAVLLQQLYLNNEKTMSDLRIEDGKIVEIAQSIAPREGETVERFGGKLALPPFIESHVHLDACLTVGDPAFNLSGTLFEGISLWSRRKEKLTKQDVRERVLRAAQMLCRNGVQYVRTHVDVTDPKLTAMEALLELRQELRDRIEIQIVAFPQEGILSYPNGKQLMTDAVAMGADAVGAIPHFEFTREYSVESLNFAVALAEKYGRLVDVHCDEIDDEASRGLETLAARAYESGLKSRVTASHTTAMHSYNNAYVVRLMRLLTMSEINFVSNPLVNTHLQGRMDTYPKRRGVTRVKELTEAGLNVSFGHDDIRDPWYPMGTGSMRDVVFLGLHVCQMMGYEEIQNSYRFICDNAARTLCLPEGSYGLRPGNEANLVILDAKDWYDALSLNAPVLRSIRKGAVIARTTPARYETL